MPIYKIMNQTWWITCVSAVALLCIILYIMNKADSQAPPPSPPLNPSSSLCDTCSIVSLPSLALSAGNNGKKRALLIGCNYSFSGSACETYGCTLNGCIDDVRNIASLLKQTLGYAEENITVLVDDGSSDMPTKQTIVSRLTSLVTEMRAGDTSFVWYSGHGAQIQNSAADGGFDECWCPPDTIESGDYLTDQVLNNIISAAPANSNLFIGSDSCHSGTVFDLEYIVQEVSGEFANRQIPDVRGRQALSKSHFENLKLGSNKNIASRLVSSNENIRSIVDMEVLKDSLYTETNANVISLSGCQDFDTSSDAYMNGEAQGAMSWAFLSSFEPDMTLTDLLRNMRTRLASNGFTQVPQITLGRILNPNLTTLNSFL